MDKRLPSCNFVVIFLSDKRSFCPGKFVRQIVVYTKMQEKLDVPDATVAWKQRVIK
jgi:hypothetical protein